MPGERESSAAAATAAGPRLAPAAGGPYREAGYRVVNNDHQPESYDVGDELRWPADKPGKYYPWNQDLRTEEASQALTWEIKGNALRLTFASGAVVEAWYVTP